MPVRQYANAPATTLASSCTAIAVSIEVASVTGLPISYPYTLIIDRGTASEEAVSVTAAAGTDLTVTRGIDGTTAFAHAVDASVVHGITAQDLREPNAHVNADSGVHGVTGDVVGTSDAQTLTNKTLDLGDNTISGTRAQFNAAMTDDDLASLAGVETLTNKTLDAPAATGSLEDFGTALTAYVPTVSGGATLGNGTITGFYIQIGKVVHFYARFVLGSTSTVASAPTISLPVDAKTGVSYISLEAHVVDAATADYILPCILVGVTGAQVWGTSATGAFTAINSTTPFTWTTNDVIEVRGTYEVA